MVDGARVYVGAGPLGPQEAHGAVPGEDGRFGGCVRTGADGRFLHPTAAAATNPEEATRLRVCGCEHGLSPAIDQTLVVAPGATVDVGDLVLGPKRARLVRGVVVDEAGDPIEGAIVTTFIGQAPRTGADGRFEGLVATAGPAAPAPPPSNTPPNAPSNAPLNAAFPGSASRRATPMIVVAAAGYLDARINVSDQDESLRVVLHRGVESRRRAAQSRPQPSPRPGVDVTLQFVDELRRPINDVVEVALGGRDVALGAHPLGLMSQSMHGGRGTLRIPYGTWNLRAVARRRAAYAATFEFAPGDAARTIEIVLEPASIVVGRVLDRSRSAPQLMRVYAEPQGLPRERLATADVAPNGDYRLDGMAPGRWSLRVCEPTGRPLGPSVEIVIAAGVKDVSQDLALY
jgi:hypothetical protein